jgi:hypothetical protein
MSIFKILFVVVIPACQNVIPACPESFFRKIPDKAGMTLKGS